MYMKSIDELKRYHLEMGNLIKMLEEVEDGEDWESFYPDMVRDVKWNNIMISNRIKQIKLRKGTLDYSLGRD